MFLLHHNMFAGSTEMIFFSILSCAIGSQGGPNKMAAVNFLWLHSLDNRSSIQPFFFLEISGSFQDLAAIFLMPDKVNLDYFNLLYCEFQKYEVMTMSVECGQQKKNTQNTQIPAIKQQNTSNALFKTLIIH